MSKKARGNLCLLLCAMFWGSTFVAQILGADLVGPLNYNFTRFLIGGCSLIPLVLYRHKKGIAPIPKGFGWLRSGIICGLALATASAVQQAGMSDVSGAGKAGFIGALYILLVPVFRRILGKKIPKTAWPCVGIALVGMYLLCISGPTDLRMSRGDLLELISAVFYTCHILTIDHFAPDGDAVQLSCVQFLTTGLVSLLVCAVFEGVSPQGIRAAGLSILYAGIFSCGVAYTLQVIGQKDADPAQASLILGMESVFSAVFGFLILGERFTLREGIGCLLILFAVVVGQCGDGMLKRVFIKNKGERA